MTSAGRGRIWIAPDCVDDPLIRALTEHYHPGAEIMPKKRPPGTDDLLQKLKLADRLREPG